MRIVLLSDIHANLVALETVLVDLESASYDHLIVLGDVAGTGPQPREVIARLRTLGGSMVMGNIDERMLLGRPTEIIDDPFLMHMDEIDQWCGEQLGDDERAYLHSFQHTINLPVNDAHQLLAFHASPHSLHEGIHSTTANETLDLMLYGHTMSISASGHTHTQMVRRYQDKLLLNPGSVGRAVQTDSSGRLHYLPCAEYALLDIRQGSIQIELRRITYDMHALRATVRASAMPHADVWISRWKISSDPTLV